MFSCLFFWHILPHCFSSCSLTPRRWKMRMLWPRHDCSRNVSRPATTWQKACVGSWGTWAPDRVTPTLTCTKPDSKWPSSLCSCLRRTSSWGRRGPTGLWRERHTDMQQKWGCRICIKVKKQQQKNPEETTKKLNCFHVFVQTDKKKLQDLACEVQKKEEWLQEERMEREKLEVQLGREKDYNKVRNSKHIAIAVQL